jgi:hypothetical protein
MALDSTATFFARPQGDRLPLEVAPRLASWMISDHPDQVRLTAFLDHAEAVVRPRIDQLPGPLALLLEVALPDTVPLLDQHDLDNYLFPLAKRLGAGTGREFVSVWGTKSVGDRSSVTVATAEPAQGEPPMEFSVATSAASDTITYKKQVRDQLARALPLPEGPVALDLAFEVGPGRDWMDLWKPTIDSLDPLLGATTPGRAWHPRDGRIVELGLHCHVVPDLGSHVYVTIAPRVLEGS